MSMATSEVVISLEIRNSLDMLSEGKVLSRGLRYRMRTAINDLQKILSTSKLLESSTDDDQRGNDHGSCLQDRARGAVDIAHQILLEASQHLMSSKGRLANIHALVRFMSLRIHVRATEKKALDFLRGVEELSNHLPRGQGLPTNDLLSLDENASSKNADQGNVGWTGKIESDIVGRKDEACKLLAQLIVEDGDQDALPLRIVWVVGKEASGKTALVRSVYNRLEIDHSFQFCVWVGVHEKFTLKDLLVTILKQTPQKELKDLEHIEEENLKEVLHKALMELKYLIVFDNLHKVEHMDELMIFLPDSRSGSRVIITARDPEIPSFMDPWASPVELHELDADQSECLLGECGSFAADTRLKASILSKCNGSPPGILLLGGLVVASGDASPVMVDRHAENPTFSDIMSLSYNKLPSILKPCLLYLCLFPKDSEISTRRLFRLWLAEGLVKEDGFNAEQCFQELAGRNWVNVVRYKKLVRTAKSCRVPSFIHDFLCKRAKQLRPQIHSNTKSTNHSEQPKVDNGCSSWIVQNQEDHQGFQLQYLRSYVSFNTQKQGTRSRDVEELLQPLIARGDCGLLRVLDLEGVYKPLLPNKLGNVLPDLRYLGLRWTVLDSIPETIRNMSCLETLDLKYTNVRSLPSSIWKVKSLQHLYMNEVCFDKSTNLRKQSAKYPSNLQTLWGLYIGVAKSPMLNVLRKLTRLKKLGLTCDSPVIKEATECISNLTELQSLKLRSRDLFGQPSELSLGNMRGLDSLSELYLLGSLPVGDGLTLLPQNLKILTLSMSGLDDHSIEVLGGFQSLEILNLLARSYAGENLNCGSGSFPRLRVLKLWMLEKVKEAHVDETALSRLEELEIKNCGLLASVNSLDHIQFLKKISLIEVKEELATNIKGGLSGKLFINGKQLVTSSSSSSRQVFIKETQLVTSSSSAQVKFHRFYAFSIHAFPH
ncbi:putative disease resistance RPP13-like protein 2 [Rhodamnia argentea]|uniref:Disease resistance RPP13-like protein 2 n=1 Tax=Rhodamnia argentea TaxID=178133 RepID=A0A8B8PVY0_9MYRT|nr:putative disease resistance RPP13-like protein 2 [Rhodamnia argentea]